MNKLYAALLLAIVFFTASSCGWRSVRGNGNVITSNRNEGNFKAVQNDGPYDVFVTQGDACSVTIEAEENLMKYIISEVRDGELRLKVRNGINLRPKHSIKIMVTAPRFNELGVAGSGQLKAESVLQSDGLMEFSISGSGDLKVNEVDAPQIKVRVSGSGNASIGGATRDADYKISGSGNIKCLELKTENTEAHISGSGDVWSYCSQNLDVHIAGSGKVHYAGNPVNVKKRIAGSGSLVKE